MHAQCAQEFVGVQRFGTQDFSQLAAGNTAMHFELPQPVARMHEAHGEGQIALRFSVDGWDAVVVQRDRGFAEWCRNGELRIVRWQAAPHVDAHSNRNHRDERDQPQNYSFQPAHFSLLQLMRIS